jgi:UDP-N-acetylglucosamine 2-epimerase (non-hydrolysing)
VYFFSFLFDIIVNADKYNSMKLAFVFGTRPEIIKIYSTIMECINQSIEFVLIHTNQHYDEKMDKIFFKELEIPMPNYNLNVGSGTHGQMTGRMIEKIEEVLIKEKPTIVIVQGDTNTVLAGSLAAVKLGIKVAHIEAGLRSYDKSMPEETNRIVTDHISDFLFAPAQIQYDTLLKENLKEKSYITGNTVVDALYLAKNLINKSNILEKYNLIADEYVLLTCHRPSNTDIKENFIEILVAINTICEKENLKCIFPVHPRLNSQKDLIKSYSNIIPIEPIGYLDSINLQLNSFFIFTDSGGIQEESCILEKKCLILRTNTERPETVEVGGAILVDKISKNEIESKFYTLLNQEVKWYNPFGDGKSSKKIIDIFKKNIN